MKKESKAKSLIEDQIKALERLKELRLIQLEKCSIEDVNHYKCEYLSVCYAYQLLKELLEELKRDT